MFYDIMTSMLLIAPSIIGAGVFLIVLYFVIKCAIKKALQEFYDSKK